MFESRDFGALVLAWGAGGAIALGCSSEVIKGERSETPQTLDSGSSAGGRETKNAGGSPSSVANGGAGDGGTLTTGSGGAPASSGGALTAGSGGTVAGTAGADAGDAMPPSTEPRIPPLPATCPELATGTVTVMGQEVQLWVGEKQAGKQGPVMFYWHGTGSQSNEAVFMLGPLLDELLQEGALVVSFSTTLGTGTNTSTGTWYTDDFRLADALLACAVAQLDIDVRRIYSTGCAAGAFQAAAMAFGRSSYLAGAMPNDGGIVTLYGLTDLEDPSHVPALVTAHSTADTLILVDLAKTNRDACEAIAAAGGFAVNCPFDGGHCGAPPEVRAAQWQFLKDHPFGTTTDPYAGVLPDSFPASCKRF